MKQQKTIWMVLISISLLAQSAYGISCYNCKEEASNAMCSQPEHITDCDSIAPPGTKYDICQTIISGAGQPDARITKKCAVGPCSLDKNQQNALGLECAGDQCIECCETDECNISSASTLTLGVVPLFIFPVFPFLLEALAGLSCQ